MRLTKQQRVYQNLFPDPEDLKEIKAPLLSRYGTDDPGTTEAEIRMFRETLQKHKKTFEIVMYKGAGHAC
jgi:dienelactone hydrolase